MSTHCQCCHADCSSRFEWQEWAFLGAGGILLLAGVWLPVGFWGKMALFIAAYLCCGSEVLLTSFHNLRRAEVFDENFLMTLATLGAFAIGEYPEGVSVMLFYQIGEKLQHYASGQSRRKITALMDLRSAFARVLQNGSEQKISPLEVRVGQTLRVRVGERIPLDGEVLHGESQLDLSSLTGESRPVTVRPAQSVLAGSINLSGVLDIRATKTYTNSAVAQILELAEHASSKKSTTEKFLTRFARLYTPVVVGLALCAAVLPPLLVQGNWHDWIYKALIFLVISCPCALVLSVPLGFFGGIGGAAHHGILIKGGSYLELLTRIGTLCFDKTGTLTRGVFEVISVVPAPGTSQEHLLHLAAAAEMHSNHPIAKAILQKTQSVAGADHVREIAGEGLAGTYQGKSLWAGNQSLMKRAGIKQVPAITGTVVYVAYDGQYQGLIELGDRLKETAQATITALKGLITQVALVSGDNPAAVQKTAQEAGIEAYFGGLLPAGKMQVLEDFMAQAPAKTSTVFVGDGVNDAPVLKRADVGIAMGGAGADAALEAADVVLMGDEPRQVVTAIQLARFTKRIIKQNIWFALGIKVVVLGLGIAGLANIWLAVFADVGVSLLAVVNSLRPLYYSDK